MFDIPNTVAEVGPVPEKARNLTLRTSLDDTEVWRRLQVPGDLRLDQLHEVLQAAMGWTDSHLHRFHDGDERAPYFPTAFDIQEGDEGMPEADVRVDQVLREPGAWVSYEYDFGDGWTHRVELEAATDDPVEGTARCLGGALACPPEDCGGVGGYDDLAIWVRSGYDDAAAPDYRDPELLRAWLPDGWHPDTFSVDEANEAMRWAGRKWPFDHPPELLEVLSRISSGMRVQTLGWLAVSDWMDAEPPSEAQAAQLVEPWQVLLRVVGDGVELTSAGYLRPAVVEQIGLETGVTGWWIGKVNREDLTPPIAHLRQSAREVGLVTVRKGRLLPTAAGRNCGDDPLALLRHIAGRLPLGKADAERDAGWLALLVAGGGGPCQMWEPNISELMSALGWRMRDGSEPSDRSATFDVLQLMSGGLRAGWRMEGPRPGVAAAARLAVLG